MAFNYVHAVYIGGFVLEVWEKGGLNGRGQSNFSELVCVGNMFCCLSYGECDDLSCESFSLEKIIGV